MNMVIIESEGLDRILAESPLADVLVLRGEALRVYVSAVSVSLGRPLDIHHATTIHGVRRRQPTPGEPVYQDSARDWFLGEPMPESHERLVLELQAARARIAVLEKQLYDVEHIVEAARGLLLDRPED